MTTPPIRAWITSSGPTVPRAVLHQGQLIWGNEAMGRKTSSQISALRSSGCQKSAGTYEFLGMPGLVVSLGSSAPHLKPPLPFTSHHPTILGVLESGVTQVGSPNPVPLWGGGAPQQGVALPSPGEMDQLVPHDSRESACPSTVILSPRLIKVETRGGEGSLVAKQHTHDMAASYDTAAIVT